MKTTNKPGVSPDCETEELPQAVPEWNNALGAPTRSVERTGGEGNRLKRLCRIIGRILLLVSAIGGTVGVVANRLLEESEQSILGEIANDTYEGDIKRAEIAIDRVINFSFIGLNEILNNAGDLDTLSIEQLEALKSTIELFISDLDQKLEKLIKIETNDVYNTSTERSLERERVMYNDPEYSPEYDKGEEADFVQRIQEKLVAYAKIALEGRYVQLGFLLDKLDEKLGNYYFDKYAFKVDDGNFERAVVNAPGSTEGGARLLIFLTAENCAECSLIKPDIGNFIDKKRKFPSNVPAVVVTMDISTKPNGDFTNPNALNLIKNALGYKPKAPYIIVADKTVRNSPDPLILEIGADALRNFDFVLEAAVEDAE